MSVKKIDGQWMEEVIVFNSAYPEFKDLEKLFAGLPDSGLKHMKCEMEPGYEDTTNLVISGYKPCSERQIRILEESEKRSQSARERADLLHYLALKRKYEPENLTKDEKDLIPF